MELLSLLEQLIGDPPAGSEDERSFCAGWRAHRVNQLVGASLYVLAGIHLVSAAGVVPLAPPATVPFMVTFHLAALAVVLGLLRLKGHERLKARAVGLMLVVDYLVYLGLTYFATHFGGTTREVVLATICVAIYGIFGIETHPGHRRQIAAFVGGLMVASFAALYPLPGWFILAMAINVPLAIAVVLRATVELGLAKTARNEFRFRSQVAPAHIVRHATGEAETLQESFRPRLSLCVCISSDWRNYQRLSANLAPDALGSALDAYYDLCQSILRRHAPRGNYYTDWIADELFIVLYAEEGAPESALVDAALGFAYDLIVAKQGFQAARGLPEAIDVGISHGQALLGLMGPVDHKKATALGEVPGRARRLQSTGKLLRYHLGDRDRIVFGRECLMRVQSDYQVRTFLLPDGTKLRDVEDREIFYVEPEARDVRAA